jgi:hypothetical protein
MLAVVAVFAAAIARRSAAVLELVVASLAPITVLFRAHRSP